MTAAIVRRLPGLTDYDDTLGRMKAFTDARTEQSQDELWLLEHSPVYTLGQAGKPEHVLAPGDIPVVQSDRGGQVTYHGPGQLVMYTLVDIRRAGLGIRSFVESLEQVVIDWLAGHDVEAVRRPGAPGVYVEDAKVAALGLRVRSGRSYHGLSVNVDMDLSPFAGINPCGYEGLAVTQLRDLGISSSVADVGEGISQLFEQRLPQ